MRVFVVDSFTDIAFRGNPAGVVLDDGVRDDAWRLSLAAELRHSETAFVRERTDGGHDLRWFTPATEVDLCGHATLAAAHVLAGEGVAGTRTFHTRSGVLTAVVEPDGIVLDFPAASLTPEPASRAVLAAALGAPVTDVQRTTTGDLLAEVADERVVAALTPDLAAVSATGARGVVVTARADDASGRDFVSRFFAPNVGVPEDPVTGSAHCALAPYWSARLGRTTLRGEQLSARRGAMGVDLVGDRVRLRGQAVTVLAGELRV